MKGCGSHKKQYVNYSTFKKQERKKKYGPDLENNVTVCLIELPKEGLVHLDGYEVFYLPNGNTRDLAHILHEELRVIQLRFLQVLVPSFGFQIRVF